MSDRRRIWPKVVLAIVAIAGGAYAVVKLDVWQAERRAQQDLHVPEQPAAEPDDQEPSP